MALMVMCEFEDFRRETVREDFADLEDAVSFALRLAGELGRGPGDGQGPPHLVHVVEDKKTELTVRVFRGGLIDQTKR